MKKKIKEEEIEKAMRIVWSSLESHLPWCYATKKEIKEMRWRNETTAFHKRCVREYTYVLKVLSDRL